MNDWIKIILLAAFLAFLLFTFVMCQSAPADYAVEYLEGKVIATHETRYGTQVTLDNGGGLTLNGNYQLIFGATYRFTFWNYDAYDNGFWGKHGLEYQGMELIID